MDQENIYYYALHNELNNLLVNIKQSLNDAIAGTNSTIKSAEEFKYLKDSLIKQDKMSGILFDSYHNISNNFYTLSSQIKQLLDELDKYIDEIELPRVESSINSDIMKINYYDKIQKLRESEASLIQLASECGLSNKELIINSSDLENGKLSFEDIIKRMIELEIESLDIDRGVIELKSQNIITGDSHINVGLFDNSKELNEQAGIKDKAVKIIELCHKIREQLQKELDENGLEFAKLQETVSMILAQNLERVDNANKFFTNFVMGQYDDIAKEEKKKENDRLKQEIIDEYDNLVIDLNRLKEQLPEYSEDLLRLETKLISMDIDKLREKQIVPEENIEVLC